MNDFTQELTQGLFNQEKLNETLCKLMQTALNELLKFELTTFLGYDSYERESWKSGNLRNGDYYRHIEYQLCDRRSYF
ncbi:transposase-like protein [Lactobacillus colini]|uniref:Transposase-like protein n=1 Tax=Lactobacillus colini TaxID=1819254 RepID=A0ABS4MEM4_9LACO|nr:transposase-like protein [Lactobacillus colini]